MTTLFKLEGGGNWKLNNQTVPGSNTVVIGHSDITDVYLGSESGLAKLIASKPKFTAIPTSADGLSAGDVWSNGGVLTIV